MTSKRRYSVIRFALIAGLLGLALGVYSPIFAQEETPPPPPPLPETPIEVTPTVEPSATTLPSETPALEPTATEAPPTETATLEPATEIPTETAGPSTETPFVEPTLEPTAEVTADSTLEPETTAEVTPEFITATPEFITATPELFVTESPTPGTGDRARTRSGRVESQLLELETLVEQGHTAQAQSFAATMQLEVTADAQMVHVEVVAADAAEAVRLRPAIERLGGQFLIGYDRRMEFNFPVTALDTLDRTSGSFNAMRPREAIPMLGAKTSEGVQATGAAQWHQRGYNGAGVRIGVIDGGFTGYSGPETAGCVKAISNFAPGTTLTSMGNHGGNVAQIVCDMAPKAEVYLAQVSTLSSLNAAVDWMISQNVNIVNMSLGWDFAGAGDGTGEVNTIVQRLADNGITLFNAAGNENGSVWHGTYSPVAFDDDGTSGAVGGTGQFVNFGGGGENAAINVLFYGLALSKANFDCDPGEGFAISVTFRWSDWNGNRTGNANNQDFDLHLYYSTDGNEWTWLDWSAAPQDSFDFITPTEGLAGAVPCYLSTTPLYWGIAVECFANCTTPTAPYMQLIAARGGNLSKQTAGSSLTSPADSQNVVAVAAGEVKAMTGFSFSQYGYPDLAEYSSQGPILGPGGTAPAGGPNNKPDVTAPTNTTTSLDTSFNGTSAASPHAAGFAALMYQFNRPTYDGLSGLARTTEVIGDITDSAGNFLRTRPTVSDRAGCGNNVNCFGEGIITIDSDFFAFTDAKLEHTDGRIIRSGAGWIQQTQSGASGGNYIYTRGTTGTMNNFAQIEFGVTNANGVQVFFWQRPDFTGSVEVLFNGSPFIPAGTTTLQSPGATPVLASFTIDTGNNYIDLNEITIRPAPGANGLSLDYVQILHNPPIITVQEDALSKFGTWSRLALSGASGGFHITNNQRGAGVQFFTNAPSFTVTYTKRPDGGIMEIWVNGQLCTACGEINTWSGTTMTSPQAVHFVDSTALTGFSSPYFVQLVNSGRQTPATTNRPYIAIDNIRFPAGGAIIPANGVEAEIGYNGQASSTFLPMNGVWTNLAQASAFGGRIFSTTTPGAEFRFNTNSQRNVVYFTGMTTGALLDIYVNGQLCGPCGRIDTYRSTTMYKIPYVFTIPGSGFGSAPFDVTLRNSGTRSSGTGTIMTMAIDRIEALDNTLAPLPLFNITGANLGSFWVNERWVASRQTDAIGSDVYINNSAFGGIWFNTCSRDFTLLLGKSPNGGIVRVKIWNGAGYDTLAEFNGQATSTTWRYGLNVSVSSITYPTCNSGAPFQMLVEVTSETQFGNTLDYGYVDALLVNDGQPLFIWGYTEQDNIDFGDPELVEVGPGWTTFAQAGAIGNDVRRTSQTTGASIQFTMNDPDWPSTPQSPRLIFSRAPDGGIAEVFVNGVFQYEISFYSPVMLKQQFLPLTLPANIQYPAVFEIRNVPRRTTGSTGYYMYIDAVIETNEPTGFATPIIGTGYQQNETDRIQLFGATWTTSSNPPTTTVFPSGVSIATTTANSGGLRFLLEGSNRFAFVSSVSANRGIAEIWVNGRLCTACGGINTFRPQTFWQVPFLVEIPISFDADPPNDLYFVDIRTTNVRQTGATGFGMSADEIIPLDGGDIDWDAAYATSVGSPASGTWSEVFTPNALNGSFFRTALASAPSIIPGDDLNGDGYRDNQTQTFEYLTPNFAQKDIILLRNTTPNGGIVEIWISDYDPGPPPSYVFRLCLECGTINNYSPYTRYQVPYFFTIPDRFNGDTPDGRRYIRLLNTGGRAAGSTGNYMEIDGFMFP